MKKIVTSLAALCFCVSVNAASLKGLIEEIIPDEIQRFSETIQVVKRAQFTTGVTDREPVDNLSSLATAYTKVLFFTEIVDYSGNYVHHEWYFGDELLGQYTFDVKFDRYRTWSRLTLRKGPGTYTVKVTNQAGEILEEKSLDYYQVTEEQVQQAPIVEQLEIELDERCEQKLEYYHEKLEEHPNNAYYKFMMRKWAKRCHVE